MKKEKKTMYSVRLMMIIIGLLIPMNLVTLLMSVFAVQGLFTQMRENTEGTLRVYMSQIDAELTSASTRSIFISQDSVDSVYLASRLEHLEKDNDRFLRSVVKLNNEYNDYLNENRWVGGMFSIYPSIDEIVFADNRYSYSRHKEEIHTYLDERIASKRAVNKWECVQFGNEASVFYMHAFKNGYFGIWYDLNNLLSVLKIPEKDDYLAVTDGEGTILFATEAMQEVLGESAGGLEDIPGGYEKVSIASESSPMVLVRLLSTGNVFHAVPFVLRIMLLFSLLGMFALPVILYLSSLLGIDPTFYEAASLDGATKWQQIRLITIPLLKPTILMLLILNLGQIFRSDFGLFYQVPMMQAPLFPVTQTIDTYVYRALMQLNNVGMSAAASFVQSIVGFIFIVTANKIVTKLDENSALF